MPNPALHQPYVGAGQPADQDVADLVVDRVGPVHPALLHQHAAQPHAGRDGRDLAGVVGLHPADRDERVAALGERVGDEVLQLAGLVAAERDAGVAVLPLGPHRGAAEVRGQALQPVHGRGAEQQRCRRGKDSTRDLHRRRRGLSMPQPAADPAGHQRRGGRSSQRGRGSVVTTDVLVVGAGPVGLVAAAELARRGVGVRIIDKLARRPRSRGRSCCTPAVWNCSTSSAWPRRSSTPNATGR